MLGCCLGFCLFVVTFVGIVYLIVLADLLLRVFYVWALVGCCFGFLIALNIGFFGFVDLFWIAGHKGLFVL